VEVVHGVLAIANAKDGVQFFEREVLIMSLNLS
jgi:hypothetical protein